LASSVLHHELLGSTIHGIEFTDLVGEANLLKQVFYLLAMFGLLEIELTHVKLLIGGGEQKVNSFRLVAIVVIVSH
jgi:hypothetical protein